MAGRKTRPNGRELKIIKKYILARDGNKCYICNHTFRDNQLIVIEHVDNDPLNWEPENLKAACQSCNIKKDPPYRNKRDIDTYGEGEGERGRLRLYNDIKHVLNLGDLAMFKNVYGELKFTDWLRKEMTKRMKIPIEEIVYDGANITGLQPKTTREYLKKLCYKTGPYRRNTEDKQGIEHLEWKPEHFPYKDLMKKYSK